MKFLLGFMMLTFSLASMAQAISISDSGISFDAPDEFQPVAQQIIDIKWPQKNAPKWVVGNKSASTTIAFDLKPNDISTVPLSAVMKHFKKTFDRVIPGIEWKKREIIELSGKKWLFLEMTSNAIDTDIYNIMLLTSYGKQMLIFNFSSTKEDFAKYETALRNSIQSIKLP
ncbi:MAG: hypothetical protein OFPII_20250 [Osedax symbiont Rs1]|nr:MAG: hypothetical protein OFPII_20250 [Osedax symbiont Rs1]